MLTPKHTQLQRVATDNLVIYTTEPEVSIENEEVPTEQELVSALLAMLVVIAVVAGAAIIIISYYKQKDDEPSSSPSPTPETSTKPETLYCCCVQMKCDTTGVSQSSSPSSGPSSSPSSGPSSSPSSGPSSSPSSGPSSSPSSGPSSSPPDDEPSSSPPDDEPKSPPDDEPSTSPPDDEPSTSPPDDKILSPPDTTSSPQSKAAETFDKIMEDYLTQTFSDAESAAAYLQQKVSEAGIVVQITESGYVARNELPDPGRVATQLRARGIQDNALIESAVTDANNAISQVEVFAKNIMATIPTGEQPVDAGKTMTPQTGDPYADLVPEWMNLIPAGFVLQPQGSVTPAPTPPTTGLAPRNLLAMKSTTNSGVIIEASVETIFTQMTNAGLEQPGYYVPPFVSVFDTAPDAWSTRA